MLFSCGDGGGDDVLASLSTLLPFVSTYDPSENALYVGLGEIFFQFPYFALPKETFVIKTNETEYRLDPITRLESYRYVAPWSVLVWCASLLCPLDCLLQSKLLSHHTPDKTCN